MFHLLLREGLAALSLDWLLASPCPLCHRLPPAGQTTAGRSSQQGAFCAACSASLALVPEGLHGCWPLNWWGSGLYEGGLRQALLNQRRRPDPALLQALLRPLGQALGHTLRRRQNGGGEHPPWLVTVPSWKRQANPLPGLIAAELGRQLGLQQRPLLERSRVVLGQHRLGRQLRMENQRGSFRCLQEPRRGAVRPVLIVDDILTTGATAGYAALCLERHGWPVLGLACLARTPQRRRPDRPGGCTP
ncbi:MAG: ComF family protein [Cyanobium sp.]